MPPPLALRQHKVKLMCLLALSEFREHFAHATPKNLLAGCRFTSGIVVLLRQCTVITHAHIEAVGQM